MISSPSTCVMLKTAEVVCQLSQYRNLQAYITSRRFIKTIEFLSRSC